MKAQDDGPFYRSSRANPAFGKSCPSHWITGKSLSVKAWLLSPIYTTLRGPITGPRRTINRPTLGLVSRKGFIDGSAEITTRRPKDEPVCDDLQGVSFGVAIEGLGVLDKKPSTEGGATTVPVPFAHPSRS